MSIVYSQSASSNEVVGIGSIPLFSSSSGTSAITSRLDAKHGLRLLDVLPVLERDLNRLAGDLAVVEFALL